ncbi:unnamed protein product [Blepharisma stoltei]|uniref:Uncharacterized protein n=1 Tax=Blepharisma stoltei TaxID=1481888 RepID=A0AAU9J0B2_9CILI|nr:unnamed protein product [Blepharisma stoltei]
MGIIITGGVPGLVEPPETDTCNIFWSDFGTLSVFPGKIHCFIIFNSPSKTEPMTSLLPSWILMIENWLFWLYFCIKYLISSTVTGSVVRLNKYCNKFSVDLNK